MIALVVVLVILAVDGFVTVFHLNDSPSTGSTGTCVYDPMGADGRISTTGGSYYRLSPGQSINNGGYRYEVADSKCD